MWDRLSRQAAVELEQLRHLLDVHRPLLVKCAATAPDEIELSALAALLHSFYTGIENIFKRVAVEADNAPPGGESWHRDLLARMSSPGPGRTPVISTTLRDTLKEYLEFRHVFRHAYSFQLQWAKMASLVLNCENTLRKLETELAGFLESGGSKA